MEKKKIFKPIVRSQKEFSNMGVQELFDEILFMRMGDDYDGCSSEKNDKELENAIKAFGEKMKEKGIEWNFDKPQSCWWC